MKKILCLMALSLIFLIGCDSAEIVSFDVLNPELCKNSGDCHLKIDIEVGGENIEDSHRSDSDKISISWGDGSSYDNTVKIWDAKTYITLATLKSHSDHILR